ncbi:hypothetical protein ACJX0J_027855, partial [Zea mays]
FIYISCLYRFKQQPLDINLACIAVKMIQGSSQEWKRAIPGMIQDSSEEWKRAIYLQVTTLAELAEEKDRYGSIFINKYTTLELFSLDKLIINLACIVVKMIQDSSQEWKRNAAYLVHQGLIFCHFFWILLLSNAAYLVIWTPQICMFFIQVKKILGNMSL